MRKLVYSVAMSLDGFIADPDGGYDWIIMDPAIDFAAMFSEFDTFVMGRKTYEITAKHQDGMSMYGDAEVIVFSKTMTASRDPRVRVVSTDPAATVRELKNKSGKNIWLFGGGVLFRSLVDEGLVDVVEVAIIPVMLSEGIPVVPPGKWIGPMKLEKFETFPSSGIVMARYAL